MVDFHWNLTHLQKSNLDKNISLSHFVCILWTLCSFMWMKTWKRQNTWFIIIFLSTCFLWGFFWGGGLFDSSRSYDLFTPHGHLYLYVIEPVKSQTQTMAANQTVCIFGSAKRGVSFFSVLPDNPNLSVYWEFSYKPQPNSWFCRCCFPHIPHKY